MEESTFSFDPEANLVTLKVCGELTAERLIALMNRAGADPRFVAGMHAVADYRDAHGSWDYSEIQRVRDYVARIPVPHPVRWAAVLKPGTLAAAGHVLVLINEAIEGKIQIRLFEEARRAQQWVRGEID